MPSDTLHLDLHLQRSPDEVREWWWEFPVDYRATDPREQPQRIVTLSRSEVELRVATYWGGPFGREMRADEVLRRRPDGSWTADVDMMGFRIRDEFRVGAAEGGGTRLTIDSTIEPANAAMRILRPLVLPALKKQMRKTWTDAAAVCDAARP